MMTTATSNLRPCSAAVARGDRAGTVRCPFRCLALLTPRRHASIKRLIVVRDSNQDDLQKEVSKLHGGVTSASQSLQQVANRLDLTQLVRYNFGTQLVLAGVSWAILFFTTHGALANGAKVGLGTIILMFSVLLTAYSAWISYGYFQKVQLKGGSVLSGWAQLKNFYDHITLNFVGILAAIISLQAAVGVQVAQSITHSATAVLSKKVVAGSNIGLQFLAQAASNTLLAHIVSILFLTLLIKRTTDSYQPIIELAEKLRA